MMTSRAGHVKPCLQYGVMVLVGGVQGWTLGATRERAVEVLDAGGWV